MPRARWGALARRIEGLLSGQLDLPGDGLDPCREALAERYTARIVSRRGEAGEERALAQDADCQRVDLARLEVMRPRGVGADHIALAAAERLGLKAKLTALGLNGHQVAAALGLIIAPLVYPASERATHPWLTRRGGLGELLDYDFSTLDLNRLVRLSDRLLAHRQALEEPLYQRERDLFSLQETVTRYDLTNTFFEGTARANSKAQRGHAKEKRSDCPLVTLALVLDSSGFPKRGEVLAGNASEPKTLAQMRRGANGGARCPNRQRGEQRLAQSAGVSLSGRQPGTAQARLPNLDGHGAAPRPHTPPAIRPAATCG